VARINDLLNIIRALKVFTECCLRNGDASHLALYIECADCRFTTTLFWTARVHNDDDDDDECFHYLQFVHHVSFDIYCSAFKSGIFYYGPQFLQNAEF